MGAGLFALSACATEEIGPGADPPPAEGTLLIAFAPADATFEERQARLAREPIGTGYQVLMDGAQLGFAAPLTLTQGSQSYISPIPAGLHHFEIVETDSGTALFAGDGEIKANAMNRFYLFGDLDDLQARFTSYALVPAPDTLHVDVINLVRGGTRIEVTTCSDPGDCSPLSAPLAFGEVFAGDFAGARRDAVLVGQRRDARVPAGADRGAARSADPADALQRPGSGADVISRPRERRGRAPLHVIRGQRAVVAGLVPRHRRFDQLVLGRDYATPQLFVLAPRQRGED
jgi:hypothetical protein